MEFSATSAAIEKQKHECIVLPVFNKRTLSPCGQTIDDACDGLISQALKDNDISSKRGKTLLIPSTGHKKIQRILLVAAGAEAEVSDAEYRKIATEACKTLLQTTCKQATWCLQPIEVNNRNFNWHIRQIIILIEGLLYRFEECKSKPEPNKPTLKSMIFHVDLKSQVGVAELAITEGQAIAAGMNTSKELGNLPANICTPTHIFDTAKKIAKGHKKLKVSALDEKAMAKLGMDSLLSVSHGSEEPAKLVILEYHGTAKSVAPIVLVGKGVTFDSGGISLKAGPGMDEMKFDMCGAASVLGATQAAAAIGLPLNIVSLMPCTENLPSGHATKPGDVVTTMSGQTVEILNTDAEGRLILCDTLTYAGRYKPEVVIDVATLTGAMIVALGDKAAGIMSNHPPLVRELTSAGDTIGDRIWELPLFPEYHEQLNSNFADMANVGGKGAGSITAGCFLAKFATDYQWAHLDIAGVAWNSGSNKGATGRPVPLLVQYLMDRCNK